MKFSDANIANAHRSLTEDLLDFVRSLATEAAALVAPHLVQACYGLLFSDVRVDPAFRSSRIHPFGAGLGFGNGGVACRTQHVPFRIATKKEDLTLVQVLADCETRDSADFFAIAVKMCSPGKLDRV